MCTRLGGSFPALSHPRLRPICRCSLACLLVQVCQIDPKWLVELAPRFFKSADPHKLSRRKRHERIEPLYDRYNDPNEWRLSKRKG